MEDLVGAVAGRSEPQPNPAPWSRDESITDVEQTREARLVVGEVDQREHPAPRVQVEPAGVDLRVRGE